MLCDIAEHTNGGARNPAGLQTLIDSLLLVKTPGVGRALMLDVPGSSVLAPMAETKAQALQDQLKKEQEKSANLLKRLAAAELKKPKPATAGFAAIPPAAKPPPQAAMICAGCARKSSGPHGHTLKTCPHTERVPGTDGVLLDALLCHGCHKNGHRRINCPTHPPPSKNGEASRVSSDAAGQGSL